MNPSGAFAMKILALEFSSPRRSVAVVQGVGGSNPPTECEAVETGAGCNKPFEMIEAVLQQAGLEREQIDTLAVGLGPGSYTGIRAAIALAQGWQLGRQVNVLGLSSAECLAAQAHAEGIIGRIAVVIDAQRGEFYLANYQLDSAGCSELEPLRLVSPKIVADFETKGERLVGPEVQKWFPQALEMFPRAATLGRLGLSVKKFTSADLLEPIYLRKTTFVKAPPARILPE